MTGRSLVRKLPVGVKARGTVLAAAGTLIAGTLALAACGTVTSGAPAGASGPAPSATGAAQSTSPSSVALPGFRVLSMSFVSDSNGFALGTVSCGTGRCDALLTSTDGGASWSQLAPPTTAAPAQEQQAGPAVSCPSGRPCVAQVRFATQKIGYAYDPSLLVTTDGGVSWQLQSAPAVSSLEAADGSVARVATPAESAADTGCSGAASQVSAAPAGGTAWQALPAPAVAQICPPVLYRQGQRLVLVGYGNPAGGVLATAQIARSGDGGKTWATGPDSCGGTDGYASAVALAPPDVLVLLCQHQMPLSTGGYAPAWVRVSVDGGASFGPDEQVPSLLAAPSGTIMHYQLAAASSGRLLVTETGSAGSRALLTENGGQNWASSLSMPAGSVVLVGYQDPLTARIAEGNQVWTTHDGGSTWADNQF
jgi:photosystem II stability/assembly factor-like uncharacterized protein